MKRLFFTLLAALLGTTSAYAVSASWSTASNSWAADGSFHTGFGATTTASFSVGVVFDVADLSTFTASTSILLGVRNNDGSVSGTGPSLELWANGQVKGKADPQTAGNGYTISTSGATYGLRGTADFNTLLKTGENTAAITVNMFTNTSSQLCTTYTLYVNGSKLVEGTHTNVTSNVYDYQNLATVADAEVYYMAGIASQADINSLPEPTVLALLALGVAGVALRRKAA
ncbi:MAG: PEP-CTERM sorting domain-containing protein [Candidatus Spyradenecus sp.]